MEVIVLDKRIQVVCDTTSQRIIGRLMKGMDLFTGIVEICKEYGVHAGQFQCIGSLEYATYVQLEQNEDGSLEYSNKVVSDTPVELLSGNGFVGYNAAGELDVHFHALFVDCNKKISGGHFLFGENPIAVTMELILLPVGNTDMKRRPDEITGMPVFQFTEKE